MSQTNKEWLINWGVGLLLSLLAAFLATRGIKIEGGPPTIILPPSAPSDPQKPTEPPKTKEPEPDPARAIVRLSMGNVGCTGTIVGPRRPDGRWWILTAAHCIKSQGQHATVRLLDGRTTGAVVQSFNKAADCAWMVTENNTETYPFAVLAKSSPEVGTAVWHAGYGVHVPGNREDGKVTALPDSNGQIRFWLSVSSGDSGGGILANAKGEIVSCVCCTTEKGAPAHVWGASPEAIQRSMPTAMVLDDWTPIDIPVRELEVPKVMPAKKE